MVKFNHIPVIGKNVIWSNLTIFPSLVKKKHGAAIIFLLAGTQYYSDKTILVCEDSYN